MYLVIKLIMNLNNLTDNSLIKLRQTNFLLKHIAGQVFKIKYKEYSLKISRITYTVICNF